MKSLLALYMRETNSLALIFIKIYPQEPIMKRLLILEKYLHMSLRLSDVSKHKATIRAHFVFQHQ